jgi:hypothetical protein
MSGFQQEKPSRGPAGQPQCGPGRRYAERTKMRYNAGERNFCDAMAKQKIR